MRKLMELLENTSDLVGSINECIEECIEDGFEFKCFGSKVDRLKLEYSRGSEEFMLLYPALGDEKIKFKNRENIACYIIDDRDIENNDINMVSGGYVIVKENNVYKYILRLYFFKDDDVVVGFSIYTEFEGYEKYLLLPHWKDIRKEKLKEAEYKCQLCNAKDVRLNVHHNNYENIGKETMNDLIVLCEDCHKKFHDKL